MTFRPGSWFWGFFVALLLRAALLAPVALSTPIYLVGDFNTDYLPRAHYLATHGRLPTASELPLDFYLRPPAYSVVLAPFAAAGLGDHEIGKAGRGLNLLVETLCLALLLWMALRVTTRTSLRLAFALLLLIQPFTSSLLLLPGPDVLLMGTLTAALALLLRRAMSEHPSRGAGAALAFGTLVALSILLRAEMVVLGGLLIPIWCWLELRDRNFRPLELGALMLPFMGAIALNIGYSLHVQERWNLWSGGQARFTNRPEIVWLRSWYGDESSKTNIGWYWYRGEHLDPSYVPTAALRGAGDAQLLAGVLAHAAAAGTRTAVPFEPLRELAERNRREAPLDFHLGIPADHAFSMWRDLPVPEAWRSAWHALNWRMPKLVQIGLQLVLLVGIVAALLGASLRSGGRLRLLIALVAVVVVTRTGLFAATINMPESRYMVPVVPAALLLAFLGWAWLIDRPRAVPRPLAETSSA